MYLNLISLPIARALLALFLLTPVLSVHASDLPELGDPSATLLSAEEDKRLGQAFMRSMRQHADIIEDPELNAYINSIGYRLLSSANSDLPFHFFIVNDPSINAFAGPGGHIGLHSGLILTAKSEGELASVMAHEIAHVTQRHLVRAFQKASNVQMQTMAAILAAILLGMPVDLTMATLITASAGNIQQQLNFTRTHEREADRVGIDILAKSSYDPRYMPTFFSRMQESYRYMENGLPELLRTHPVTPNRIADSQNRAEQYPRLADKDSGNFALIKAKLQSIQPKNSNYRLKALELRLKNEQTLSETEQYEYARFQLQQRNISKAANISKALLNRSPENIHYIVLQAEIEFEQAHFKPLQQRLHKALLLFPKHPQLTLLYANTLIQLEKPGQAAKKLRALIHQHEDFLQPLYYQELAKAEFANKQAARAYQAMADYYFMIGQTLTAIEQLQSALKATNATDKYQQERINARLEILKQEALIEKQLFGESNN